jgi:hypothetical protein
MRMPRAARSVALFGIYLVGLGGALMVAPNGLLALFGLPPVTDVWIRVLGVIVLNLGVYYLAAARSDAVPFFRASVATRVFVLASCTAFVLLGWVRWTLLLVGLVDAIGGLWTALALRRDRTRA